MKKIMMLVLVFSVFLGVVSCIAADKNLIAADKDLPPLGYTGPIANSPVYFEGEYWVLESESGLQTKWKFLREEGDLFVFQSDGRKDLLYKDHNLIRIKKINGETKEIMFERNEEENSSDSWKMKFPLWVGKKWDVTYMAKSRRSGILVPIDATFQVTAYEDVKIKNKTFKGFRIEKHWNARWSSKSYGQHIWYYLPEPKIRFSPDSKFSLVEFSVRTEPISVK